MTIRFKKIKNHYNKHVLHRSYRGDYCFSKPITQEEYYSLAKRLVNLVVDGVVVYDYTYYKNNKLYCCKFNSLDSISVIYYNDGKDNISIVTCYKTNFDKFIRRKNKVLKENMV